MRCRVKYNKTKDTQIKVQFKKWFGWITIWKSPRLESVSPESLNNFLKKAQEIKKEVLKWEI